MFYNSTYWQTRLEKKYTTKQLGSKNYVTCLPPADGNIDTATVPGSEKFHTFLSFLYINITLLPYTIRIPKCAGNNDEKQYRNTQPSK